MTAGARGRVAVVIPVFERPALVREALQSVREQHRPPDVLVVVDDGSRDETLESVRGWGRKARLPFALEVVAQPRGGVARARNRGARSAGAVHWIAFLDSDDRWPANYLAAHLEVLETRSDAVAATCDKESSDAVRGRTRRVGRAWVAAETTREIARRGPPGVSNTVVSAAHFEAVGGFSEDLETAEDLDLMLRLSLRGPWLYVPTTTASYRHRLGEMRGEAGSLGHQHPDRRRTRARVLERFHRHLVPRDPDLAAEVAGLAARQWARAGRALREGARHAEAVACFDRALAARPWDVRSRWARARSARA